MRSSFKVILIVSSFALGWVLQALRTEEDPVSRSLTIQADSLLQSVRLLQAIPFRPSNRIKLQQNFRQLRLAYKKLEWATTYFDPLMAMAINGPPVPELEPGGMLIEPDGLQVMEAYVFPGIDPKQQSDWKSRLDGLQKHTQAIRTYFAKTKFPYWQVLDALKQEVFRVEILGLNDFDDPLNRNCFAESAAALQSVGQVLRYYSAEIPVGPALTYLSKPGSFDRFDRARFIRNYADPITRSITRLQQAGHLPDIRYNRLLRQDAATLFEPNAFNRNAFIVAPEDSATNAKILLGKTLFFDGILSGNGNRSCASCHQPGRAFTDGLVKNLNLEGKRTVLRNTPTLINAAFQATQFYDQRAPGLEDQVRDVVQNKNEMHGDMQIAIGKLWERPNYRQLFSEAYPQKERAAIDTFEVMNALASYIRSLSALNSRFDAYMQGNSKAISLQEKQGFNLFMGKAKCSTCHYLPLFNGTLPPRYIQDEAEVIGVPARKNGKRIDPDPGTGGINPLGFNRHAFKISTVRNAARTAPYMHNGVFQTLADVIDFYDQGGGVGIGIPIPNQTLDSKPLHLTKVEKDQLIAFIRALNTR